MINKCIRNNFILTIMAVMLILALALPALAQEPASPSSDVETPVLINAPLLPDYVAYDAELKEFEIMIDSGKVVGILAVAEGNEEWFNIFEDTVIIDNETGTPGSLNELKSGDKIFVYGSQMKTRSLPPQSRAIIVLTNIGPKAPTKYLTVMNVEKGIAGNTKVFDSNGEFIVNITNDTVLLPYLTKQIVMADDIKPGSKILVWSEIMTLSLPAQMTADRIILLPEEKTPEEGRIIISQMAGVIAYNGLEITPEDDELFYTKHDTLMIPLRKVTEALGYEVKWFPEGSRIELHKDGQAVNLQIGKRQYNDKELTIAPELTKSYTFVPTEFLEEILGFQVTINNHHV